MLHIYVFHLFPSKWFIKQLTLHFWSFYINVVALKHLWKLPKWFCSKYHWKNLQDLNYLQNDEIERRSKNFFLYWKWNNENGMLQGLKIIKLQCFRVSVKVPVAQSCSQVCTKFVTTDRSRIILKSLFSKHIFSF